MSIYWIIFLLVIIYILSQHRLTFTNITISDVSNIAKTGDILLFRWNSVDIIHNMLSFFTHIGIIVEIDNIKYVLETHLKGDTKHMGNPNGGVNIYKLENRINMYNGHNFLLRLKDNLVQPYHTQIIKQNIQTYMNIPFFENYKRYYIKQCLPRKFCHTCFVHNSTPDNFMYCSQFVGHILKDLLVLDPNKNIDCISPYDFIFLKHNNSKIFQDTIHRIVKN